MRKILILLMVLLILPIISAFQFIPQNELDFTYNPWTFKQQYLRNAEYLANDTNFNSKYVEVAGDTMTGNLNINANLSSYFLFGNYTGSYWHIDTTDRYDDESNMFIYDIENEQHHLNVDLEKFDELRSNTFTKLLNMETFYNATGDYINISTEDGGDIAFIYGNGTTSQSDRFEYNNVILKLTSGTNTTPVLNRVLARVIAGVPTWTVTITKPNYQHVMAARVLIGDSGNVYGASLQEDGMAGFAKRVQRTNRKRGLLYEDGFEYIATSSNLDIESGTYINGIYDSSYDGAGNISENGFYQILSTGDYIQEADFSDITEYSDGNSIGNNKYFNVIFGIVPTDGTGRIYAVVQSKPTVEYTSTVNAYADGSNTLKVYPTEQFLKLLFIPVARMIINSQSDLAQILPNGFYAEDYRGGIGGGVSSGGGLSEADPVWAAEKVNYLLNTGDTASGNYIFSDNVTVSGTIAFTPGAICPDGYSTVQVNGSVQECRATVKTDGDDRLVGDYAIDGDLNITGSYYGDGSELTGISAGGANCNVTGSCGPRVLYGNYTNTGDFVMNGTNTVLSIVPISGAGTRMMWVPKLAVFRAGTVTGTQWDTSSVGQASFGSGIDVISDGSGSFASGKSTVVGSGTSYLSALRSGAFAQGITESQGNTGISYILSDGAGSFAQGNTFSTSSGTAEYSVIQATYQGGFAQGYARSDKTTVAGIRSEFVGAFAQGIAQGTADIESSGLGSFSQGVGFYGDISASGWGAFAQGYGESGYGLDASGYGSFVHGYTIFGDITASGDNSLAIGDDITASATLSQAFGKGYTNNVANSFMAGYSSTPTLTVVDGTVSINNKSGTTYPLEVYGTTSGVSAWFEGNVSATGYNTRTEVYNGDALENIHDSSYYKEDEEIDHSKFGECSVVNKIPIYKTVPILTNTSYHNCTDVYSNFTFKYKTDVSKENEVLCDYIEEFNYENQKTLTGYKNVTEVNLVCWTAKLEQGISQYKEAAMPMDIAGIMALNTDIVITDKILTKSRTIDKDKKYSDYFKDKEKLSKKTEHYAYTDGYLDMEQRVEYLEGVVFELLVELDKKRNK